MPVNSNFKDGQVLTASQLNNAFASAASEADMQQIQNGTAPDAGALTGAETAPTSRGTGLLQTIWNDVASFVLSIFTIIFVAGTGAIARTIIAKLLDRPISVKDFGARGDGATNDSVSLMAADTAARLIGSSVYVPAGTYMAFGLTPTVPWMSDSWPIIKNNNPLPSTNAGFVTATSVSGITTWECEGIVFDGSASADPVGGWTSANYDSFTGSSGLICFGLSGVKLRRVKAQNAANGAGIRIDTCTSVTLDDVTTTRSRGKFGDGIYIGNSSYVKLGKHSVSDYTRIGVVSEQGSYEIDIADGTATNGHDSSILYGGTEYNAGYWSENTGSVRRSKCVASSNTHYGFTNTTGTVPLYTLPLANHSNSQCEAFANGLVGFLGMSVAGLPVSLRRSMCASYGAPQAFVDEAGNDTDTFINSKCHADFPVTGTGVTQIGFQWGSSASFTRSPLFQYEGCTTRYSSLTQSDLDNTASNNADFSCFAGGVARVKIINCHQTDSTLPMYLKQRTGNLDLVIENGNFVTFINNDTGKVRFENFTMTGSTASTAFVNGAGDFESNGSSYLNNFQIGVTGNIVINGGQTKMPAAGSLQVIRTLASARPAFQINGMRFEKDIGAGSFILKIQENANTPPTGAPLPLSVLNSCTFYNSGAATSTNPFIWAVRAGTPIQFSGCVSDSSVTSLLELVSTMQANPTGNTLVAMH